ncbi:MAG: glutathione ABC transporter ATP-binding protein, partial [Actinomycetota bacterium]|nr:glutathione ABC transporter ATP-binding protein [Actinomycetota bacterium]
AQIVELLASLCEERDTAIVLITHDLALLAGFAERILVMYAGSIVEQGPVDTIYYGATHPYTWGLMESVTRPDEHRRRRLSPIRGTPPSALAIPPGCPFHPRCPHAEEVCVEEVPALVTRPAGLGVAPSGAGHIIDHPSACHFAGELPRPDRLRDLAQRGGPGGGDASPRT